MNAGVYNLFEDSTFCFSRSKKISLKGLLLVANATHFYPEAREEKLFLVKCACQTCVRYDINVT
jgi:hypothetical protein